VYHLTTPFSAGKTLLSLNQLSVRLGFFNARGGGAITPLLRYHVRIVKFFLMYMRTDSFA